MNTATKTGIDASKTAYKKVVQETAEATEYLIGNKIADKITSLSKTKSKDEANKRQKLYIPSEKYSKYKKIKNQLCINRQCRRFRHCKA